MESRLVLVIEGDDHIAHHLAAAIRDADYEVVVSPSAAAGLAAAIEIRPDCVVCDVDLPDEDGYSVARNLRAHPSPVSVTPFLFLSAYDDAQARLEGFQVGGDVYVTKPFRIEEVVAQIHALVQLASRLRRRRDSMLSIPPEASYGTTAIEGDVRQMSIATVLSVLGMERRTGVFEVVSKKRRAQVEIVSGYVVHGTIGGTRGPALQALRLMLSWKVGRFSFMPLPPFDPPSNLHTVQALLLDAAKAEDEAAAGMPASSLRMFDGHLVTSLGGPPSRPDDTGPPSSRAMREAAAGPVSLAFDLVSSRRSDELIAAPPAGGAPHLVGLDAARASAAVAPSSPGAAPHAKRSLKSAREQAPVLPEDAAISIDLEDIAADSSISVLADGSFSVMLEGPLEGSVETSVSVMLESPPEGSVETSVSVSLEELEAELGGDRMLIDETPRAQQVAVRSADRSASKAAGRAAHRATPTPPSGVPIVVRRTPAIVPPPGSGSKDARPLPAPPAPPRPAPRTLRAAHRATTKKG